MAVSSVTSNHLERVADYVHIFYKYWLHNELRNLESSSHICRMWLKVIQLSINHEKQTKHSFAWHVVKEIPVILPLLVISMATTMRCSSLWNPWFNFQLWQVHLGIRRPTSACTTFIWSMGPTLFIFTCIILKIIQRTDPTCLHINRKGAVCAWPTAF